MDRENIEQALIKKPIAKNGTEFYGADDIMGSSVTPLLLFSTFVAISASFTFGCATGYSSAAQTGIVADLGLSTAQYSIFGSMLTFGSMFGAIASGKLADLVGRKPTMLLMDIFFIIGWSAIIFAEGAWYLHLGRLSLGFGSGIQSYLTPVYVAEITPKNIRGAFSAAHQILVCVGVSLTFFLGNVIAWQTLAVIGALPCLLHVFGLFFIQESPRWLAKIGKEKQFIDTLQCLRGVNADVTKEAAEIQESIETFSRLSRSRFMEMFEKKYALALTVVVGTLVIVTLGGSMGIVFYASSIFKVAGSPISFGTTAIAIIQVPVSALGVLILDRSGRRPVLMASLIGAGFGSFLVGSAFVLQDLNQLKELTPALVLIGVMINLSSFAMAAAIPWVIMSELLPINIKGSAGSLATFIYMFVSWIVSYAFNFLLEWSPSGTFFIFATFSGLAILFVAKLVPETKGRTLEEIEASILI
ncbi:sugar transporter ERD6-like 5 isoform X1 [Daucus carota subsp. sativus]|uniref:sugar transporter ERD6-like 5 isoform X1 n=2 Tax=Daucus carota subsp. sativus TaxID=79200 RepID=UPI0007DFB0B7|nr:PREDICTED: sugar transporter ERD6-like 5 [Daucus carota subsp. sativus]